MLTVTCYQIVKDFQLFQLRVMVTKLLKVMNATIHYFTVVDQRDYNDDPVLIVLKNLVVNIMAIEGSD